MKNHKFNHELSLCGRGHNHIVSQSVSDGL